LFEYGHHEPSQDAQIVGGIAIDRAALIFVKGTVSAPMQVIFNSPLLPDVISKLLGTAL
jgi:hypothetical protein